VEQQEGQLKKNFLVISFVENRLIIVATLPGLALERLIEDISIRP